jgi:hypothetical protein
MSKEKKASIEAAGLEGATTASVPNGTAISTADFTVLVARYRGFLRVTAEGIIRIAQTLVEAKKSLPPPALSEFLKEIDMRDSTFRRWVTIGEHAARFEPVLDRTPPAWTTMYPLAVLPDEVFERVKNDKRFKPEMSQKDLAAIVKGPSREDIDPLPRDVTLGLGHIDRAKKIEACSKLRDLVLEYGLRYEIGSQLAKELMPKQTKKNLLANLPEVTT